MADNTKFVSIGKKTLTRFLSTAATALYANNLNFDEDGTRVLAQTDLGDYGWITIEPRSKTSRELCKVTGISGNVLTIARGFKPFAPYDQDTATWAKAHEAGTSFVFSNAPQLYDEFAVKDNDETITGTWTFDEDARPKLDADLDSAVNEELVTFGQLTRTSVSGGVNASEITQGFVEMGTAAQATAGTATGETGASLALTPARIAAQIQSGSWLYAVEDGSGSDDTYTAALTPALPAYTAGQMFAVKLTVANTGACTINFNGLGAKNIKKYASGAQADPETGDIVANMPCIFLYDGTSMILMNPGATMPTTALLSEMAAFFGATDITGAEAETLTAGPTSDASSKHTHISTNNSKQIILAYPIPLLSGSAVAISSRRSNSSDDFVFVASGYDAAGGGSLTGMYQGTNNQASIIASASKDIFLYEEPDRRSIASLTLSPGGVVYKVGGSCHVSETTAGGNVYYNGSSCSFDSNACTGALNYSSFYGYLLICNSTTTIRRFSGAGTTSLTYVDTITLSSAVDVDKGFFYKDTTGSYFFISGTNIKEFNSSGTLQNTYSHSIASAMIIGVVGIGGVLYIAFREGMGCTDSSSAPDISMLSIRLLPTTLTY